MTVTAQVYNGFSIPYSPTATSPYDVPWYEWIPQRDFGEQPETVAELRARANTVLGRVPKAPRADSQTGHACARCRRPLGP
jgi:hypothetical protein